MKLLRQSLTYANVMSTIAVVFALGGATAFAATHLAKNTIGQKQIRANAVNGVKVKDGTLTGADINESTLGQVPSAQTAQQATSAASATTADTANTANSAKRADSAAPSGPARGELNGAYPNPSIAPGAVGTGNLADNGVTAAKLAANAVGKEALQAGSVTAASLGPIIEVEQSVSQSGIIHGPGEINTLTAQCPSGSRVISGGYDSGVVGVFAPSSNRRTPTGWLISGNVPGATPIAVRVFAYCLT
jgi:hypothetical protein